MHYLTADCAVYLRSKSYPCGTISFNVSSASPALLHFFYLSRQLRDININVGRSSCKESVVLSILTKIAFIDGLEWKSPQRSFTEIYIVGFVLPDARTDTHDGAKARDTLSSRHVSSCDVTRAVEIWEAIWHRILWRRFTLCLRHVISRGALVGSRASTPLIFLLSHTFRKTWRVSQA
jgi:hypothetical protein